jgi:hypothetical protein
MSAMSQIQSHESVSRLEASHEYCHIGLCSGMRLDIGILSLVELAESVDGQLLYLIYDLATSIVSCSRVSLCIFVGAD